MSGEFLDVTTARVERSVDGGYEVFTLTVSGQEVGVNKLAKSPTHEPALAERFPDTPVAYQLFIAESHRGQGLARLLMDAVEQAARDNGSSSLLLGVLPDNEIARGLYERRGYKYLEIDGSQTVESIWSIKKELGEQVLETVQVMPMILDLRLAGISSMAESDE